MVDVEEHVNELVASEVLERGRRDAACTVEFAVDLVSKDGAELPSQGLIVVVGGRIRDNEQTPYPADDPPAPRACALHGNAS